MIIALRLAREAPARTILNRFNANIALFFAAEKPREESSEFGSCERKTAVRLCGGTLHNLTAGLSPQEQPVKSVRATLVVVAGVTFNG
jgi:hypothetical protein